MKINPRYSVCGVMSLLFALDPVSVRAKPDPSAIVRAVVAERAASDVTVLALIVDTSPSAHSDGIPIDTLVADAKIGDFVYLPVNIHGHAATMVLDLGAPHSFMFLPVLEQFGVSVVDALDSLTFGTGVVHEIAIRPEQFVQTPSGQAPVAGVLGADVLSHYDLVFDGPAQRVRLYASASTSWLPQGITPVDCVPLKVDPIYLRAIIPLAVNGHAVHSEFDSGASSTWMNLAAARMLGITKRTPGVRLLLPGNSPGFVTYRGQKGWQVPAGLVLTMGTRTFAPVPVFIYQHTPGETGSNDPSLGVGTEAIRDRMLFVSYRIGRVCLSAPSVAPASMAHTPSDRTIPDSGDTQVYLTTDALTRMTTFWTTFLHESSAIRDTAQAQHLVRLTIPVALGANSQLFVLPRVVDMQALAARYPSVAADFAKAGLTAQQWTQLRTALYTATLTEQAAKLQGVAVPPASSVVGANITFLRTHSVEFAVLTVSGMWFPRMSAYRDYGGDLDP